MTSVTEILSGARVLKLPCFFASVSSVKTNFSPCEYLHFLEKFGFPTYLISAYDVISSLRTEKENTKLFPPSLSDRDSIILLDSGNYEAYWLHDMQWNLSSYYEAVESIDADLVLSFDDPWSRPNEIGKSDHIEKNHIPIIHGNPQSLPDKFSNFAEKADSLLIAVPERELGDGIVQRVETLYGIRTRLDNEKRQVRIHLLGTGNPLSILLYAAYGGDSFDGLEWCQTTVDHDSARLFHFSQRELFKCDCEACSSGDSYSAVTLGHNLLFYLQWMNSIREHQKARTINVLLEKYLAPALLENIYKITND